MKKQYNKKSILYDKKKVKKSQFQTKLKKTPHCKHNIRKVLTFAME